MCCTVPKRSNSIFAKMGFNFSIYLTSPVLHVGRALIVYARFVINNAFKKIPSTRSCDMANECVLIFNCSLCDIVHKLKN